MLDYIRKLWKIEDLRKKILYTFGMLILFRLVGCIPAPGIDLTRLGMGGNDYPLPDGIRTSGTRSSVCLHPDVADQWMPWNLYRHVPEPISGENQVPGRVSCGVCKLAGGVLRRCHSFLCIRRHSIFY